jgi:hypothetical protein
MKTPSKRKKIILIVVVALILIGVLRETGAMELSYYIMHIKTTTNKSWSGIALIDKIDVTTDSASRYLNNCGQPVSVKNISVEAKYGNDKYTITTDTCDKEFVELSTFNTGIIWTPLIKKTSFQATANVSLQLATDWFENKQFCRKRDTENGSITINGHVSIIGLCSYKEARKIILTYALKELAQEVRNRLRNLD